MATEFLDRLMESHAIDANEAIARRRDDTQLATARQRDGAAFDMRILDAAISTAVVQSDDPVTFGLTNAGVRVPTTLPQDNVATAK